MTLVFCDGVGWHRRRRSGGDSAERPVGGWRVRFEGNVGDLEV